MYPYFGPQLSESTLMKYGAVNDPNQDPRNPTAVAAPSVYERSRWQGNSPLETDAYGPMKHCSSY